MEVEYQEESRSDHNKIYIIQRVVTKSRDGTSRPVPLLKCGTKYSAVKYTNTLLPSDIYASAHYFSCDRLGLYAPRPNRQTQRIAAKQRAGVVRACTMIKVYWLLCVQPD